MGAFLAQPSLRLSSIVELDTKMQAWLPDPGDGRVVRWNIAVTAESSRG
jgi:hypothetical protein